MEWLSVSHRRLKQRSGVDGGGVPAFNLLALRSAGQTQCGRHAQQIDMESLREEDASHGRGP
jgi:hypothetical protein